MSRVKNQDYQHGNVYLTYSTWEQEWHRRKRMKSVWPTQTDPAEGKEGNRKGEKRGETGGRHLFSIFLQ